MYSPMLRVAPVTIATFPSSLIILFPSLIAAEARSVPEVAPASRLISGHVTVLAVGGRGAMKQWMLLALAPMFAWPAWADDAADWRRCEKASADPPAGIAACTRLIDGKKQTPSDHALAHYNRGNAFAVLNQYARAIEDYGRAIELNPKDAQAHANRGLAFYALRKYALAVEDFDQAIALEGKDPNFYNLRGATYRAMNKFEEAILDYDHAIDLKPDFAQAYNNRGNAYAMQGNNARAIEDYDKAIKLVPNYASAYQNRAAAHEVLGNKAEAIRDYRAALRHDTNLEDSRKGLSRLTAQR